MNIRINRQAAIYLTALSINQLMASIFYSPKVKADRLLVIAAGTHLSPTIGTVVFFSKILVDPIALQQRG